jgi:hypothetical protein
MGKVLVEGTNMPNKSFLRGIGFAIAGGFVGTFLMDVCHDAEVYHRGSAGLRLSSP